ncbi:MAG: hypothetical protein H0U76_25895 [Ktedonobacteraceae bacterium]|nr:hypothetical protein [Ktedonobacteraceae bacterium]
MPHDAQHYHSQQFEHIIATVFTCRSIIKYNLTLSSEQKEELFKDIDTSLEALRSYLITPLSEMDNAAMDLQSAQSSVSSVSETDALSSESAQIELSSEKQILHSLYKVYHSYMDEKQSPNISTFMKRFNEALSAINEIQQNIQSVSVSSASQDRIASSLQDLRMFISDLYSMFMEFIRIVSDLLQQSDVDSTTEHLSSSSTTTSYLQGQTVQQERKDSKRDLTVLSQAYTTHQQLDRLKGDLAGRVREVTTFLNFLKQNVANTASGREELIVRLNYATNLLDDMSRLLTEYEKAASTLL